jgi:hypothetical protein
MRFKREKDRDREELKEQKTRLGAWNAESGIPFTSHCNVAVIERNLHSNVSVVELIPVSQRRVFSGSGDDEEKADDDGDEDGNSFQDRGHMLSIHSNQSIGYVFTFL